MRRSRLGLSAATCGILATAAGATPALAAPEDSPNAVTVTLTCPFGQVSGTAPSPNAPLFTDAGGLVKLQGVTDLEGTVLVPITPGLESTGKLVPCTFFSPSRQQLVVAHVMLIP